LPFSIYSVGNLVNNDAGRPAPSTAIGCTAKKGDAPER
jgi:hypothetical protein